jgi:CheY-like chemotaxis protein/nitrogen-specific signal transduction histidine kinase
MSTNLLLTIIILIPLAVLAVIGRIIYQRSQSIRKQLQMSAVFTNITHELLTPLTVISASVDKLREEEPEYGRDYDLMQINIQRMVRLLQQILETSKSQSGQLKLLVAQGDVMRYIRETAEYLEPLIKKKKMKYIIECHPESMMGWIDTDKLDKIIYNLLSNAAKYSREGGEVSIKAGTNKNFDHLIIYVSDTGNGIPKEKMKNLFRRFQDGEYRQHKVIGTGLGLALTQDLVALHKGTIRCNSEEGKGTTFIIDLPINKEAFTPDQIFEDHQITFDTSKNPIIDFSADIPDVNDDTEDNNNLDENAYKVLIVEDNVELLILMRQLLRQYYRVYVAQNGREALNIIQQKALDLIVSDVMMPEMSGYELTKAIKDDPKHHHLPIILLTARTQEEDEQKALLVGADEYLTKPFHLTDLKLRIDNIIENRNRVKAENGQSTIQESQPEIEKKTPEELFVERARQFVLDHLEDEDYDREALAADMGSSSSTLYNKLRAINGMNVSAFIRDIRMQEAKRIATTTPDIRISDLAYRVGFRDPRYFSTCFKKHFGMQPTEFLDTLQRNT